MERSISMEWDIIFKDKFVIVHYHLRDVCYIVHSYVVLERECYWVPGALYEKFMNTQFLPY